MGGRVACRAAPGGAGASVASVESVGPSALSVGPEETCTNIGASLAVTRAV